MVSTYLKIAKSGFSLLFFLFLLGCNSDSVDSAEPVYQEKHRNQYHFSPEANWMNDPNGLVYYDGEYHMFYQYFPDSTVWGPMHWGHAVSHDMVEWEELPIALYPDSLGYIFSGSAVVDWDNTSGFATNSITPPMIAFFTHHLMEDEKSGAVDFQYQSLAYSLDKGRTWTKYSENPIIDNPGIKDFRDPKVIWDGTQWVMVFAAFDRIKFYTSENLLNWTFQSDFGFGHGAQGRPWECPDLFPLIANEGQVKWVLIVSIGKEALNGGSGTQYFVGDWDGNEFRNDEDPAVTKWLDYGKDNYAGVTWSDIPEEDGRRLFIGWMSNWQYAQVVPTTVWRSAMTLPRKLELKNHQGSLILSQHPVEELDKLREETIKLNPGIINSSIDLLQNISDKNGLYELELTFERPDSFPITVSFGNDTGSSISAGYNPLNSKYFIDRTFAGKSDFSKDFAGMHQSDKYQSEDSNLKIHIFIDKASIELFAEDGKVVMTDIFFPRDDFSKLEIVPSQGSIKLQEGRVHRLKSVWSLRQAQ